MKKTVSLILIAATLMTLIFAVGVSADGKSIDYTTEEPIITPAEGAVMTVDDRSYTSHAEGWSAAVKKATELKTKFVTVTLYADWTAKNGSFGSGTGFYKGLIDLDDPMCIRLNLNGHTINRGLTSYKYNGEVIGLGSKAFLIINGGIGAADERTGVITGGFSCNGGGGLHIQEGSTCHLNNVSVRNNKTEDDDGAGVFIEGDSTFIMKGGDISENSIYRTNPLPFGDVYGAGMNIESGTVELDGVTFDGNYFIYNKILANQEDMFIGAAVWNDGKATFKNCVFKNHWTKGEKLKTELICTSYFGSETNFINCEFKQNDVPTLVRSMGGKMNFENCTMTDNGACDAIKIPSSSTVKIKNSEIKVNSDKYAIHDASNGKIEITDSTIEGMIYSQNSKITVKNTEHSKITSDRAGSIIGSGSEMALGILIGMAASAIISAVVIKIRSKKASETSSKTE